MRAILFFFGWLILCFTSAAAKEVNFSGSDAPTTFIEASKPISKKKNLFETKFKRHQQKARLSVVSNFIPKLFLNANCFASIDVLSINSAYNRFVNNISKLAIFNHIYPKHAFW